MGFNREGLGEWTPEITYEVKTDAIKRYADAVNDRNPHYHQGLDSVAPPLFPIVAAWGALTQASSVLIPPELYARVVHLIQDMRFRRAIRAGDLLRIRARTCGIVTGRSHTSGITYIELRDQGNESVGEMYVTFLVRGHKEDEQWGEAAPSVGVEHSGEPVAVGTETIDADQTQRYAEASGDFNPIHLDESFAQSVGFPTTIVHGMCTMAFAARAVVEKAGGGHPERLRRFAGYFSKIVLPQQTLTTSIWQSRDNVYAFETSTDDGVVIRDGVAEFAKDSKVTGTD